MEEIRVDKSESLLTGRPRYKFYIHGQYSGSAGSKRDATRIAKEMLKQMKENKRKRQGR